MINIEQLVSRIEMADWTVLDESGELAGTELRPVAELTRHSNTEVRELALYVLDAMGGRAAQGVIFERLRDPNEMIRLRAMALLSKRSKDLDLASIQEELRANPDLDVRSRMARLLGALGDGSALDPLTDFLTHESDANVRYSIRLAMAKLGDHAQYPLLLEVFKRDEPRARLEALSDIEYVGSPSLVKDALFLLDDNRDVLNVGFSHFAEYVRVCDMAISAFDRVLSHPFKFSVDKVPRRYTPEEIQQAKHLVSKV